MDIPLKATSYQVGKVVNAIRSDSNGNLIFSDVVNTTGVTLTQVKNSLIGSVNYDISGSATIAASVALSASEIYIDTQTMPISSNIILENEGRISGDSMIQTQITIISGNNISETEERSAVDLLLQSQIISISSNVRFSIQASTTPSLAVISGGKITITHPTVTNGKILPVAKINTVSPLFIDTPTTSMNGAKTVALEAEGGSLSVVLSSGNILLAGGYGNSYQDPMKCDLFDPATNLITSTGGFQFCDCGSKNWHTATLLNNGMVLTVGGYGAGSYAVKDCELYNSLVGTWANTGKLNTARRSHRSEILPSGNVIAVGGGDEGNWYNCEIYDYVQKTWSSGPALPGSGTWIWGHTLTKLNNGKILMVGGTVGPGGNATTNVNLYDESLNSWTAKNALPAIRSQHTATLLLSGKVLITGGTNDSDTIASCVLYDPIANTWTSTGSLSYKRKFHTAVLLPDGRVLISGGTTNIGFPTGNLLVSQEVYDPTLETWSAAVNLTVATAGHSAVLMPNNKVLIAGGGMSAGYAVWNTTEVITPPPAPQYDPAVIGRTGSISVDVEVTHPTSTTTVFKNVTGSTNDFIFEVIV